MKIPRLQSDIKLSTFLKYKDYYSNLTERQLKNQKLLMKNTIKIFYDINDDKYNSMPAIQVIDMFQIIHNILNTPQKIVPIFKIKDVEYGIEPNFNDITFAQLIDLNTDDILTQMCILYRQIDKRKNNKYTIKPYEADLTMLEDFKNELTLDVYNGFIGFFLRISKSLENNIQMFLTKKQKQAASTQQQKKASVKNGDGTDGYTI